MSSSRLLWALGGLVAALAVPAQQPEDAPARNDWDIGLGAATIISPDFPGSTDTDVMPVPFIDIEYKDRFFLNVPRGIGAYLVREKSDSGWGHSFGLSIAPEFEDREREDAPNLPEVDMTATGRVFGGLSYGDFSLEATFAHDIIGNGHDGYWLDLDLDWSQRIGRNGFISLGPQVRFAGGDYMESFFSVTPTASATSGLPVFNADAGLAHAGARLLASWRVTRHWEVFGLFNYEHLVGDAGDSPITVDDEQLSSVVALVYRF